MMGEPRMSEEATDTSIAPGPNPRPNLSPLATLRSTVLYLSGTSATYERPVVLWYCALGELPLVADLCAANCA